MIYFTDMMLIPGDGNSSEDLRKAMAGTGMVKCSQLDMQADLVLNLNRIVNELESAYDQDTSSYGPTPYYDEFKMKIRGLMEEKDGTVEYDVGGAWGGPGGPEEYGGFVKHEPETSYATGVADTSPVVIHVEDMTSHDLLEAADLVKEMGPDNEQAEWQVDPNVEADLLVVSWRPNEGWEPDGPDEPEDKHYDGPYGPPADWDPYGGP